MLNKDLNYYKSLNYNIIIEKLEVDNESWYIAFTSEFGKFACYGRGDTQVEALNSVLEEKDAFIEYLFNSGKPIPEPHKEEVEKFSGFFNVRTSSIIHANLVHQAKELDISLNLYVNQLLAAAIENHKSENVIMNKLSELCGQLEKHHFEVTKQLKYQTDPLSGTIKWSAEYHGLYLKSA
jgi:predicted HicB family RNase H-like nuclease